MGSLDGARDSPGKMKCPGVDGGWTRLSNNNRHLYRAVCLRTVKITNFRLHIFCNIHTYIVNKQKVETTEKRIGKKASYWSHSSQVTYLWPHRVWFLLTLSTGTSEPVYSTSHALVSYHKVNPFNLSSFCYENKQRMFPQGQSKNEMP